MPGTLNRAENVNRAKTVVLECRMCGERYPDGFQPVCLSCGGTTDVFYDLRTARIGSPGDPSPVRYADLLPIADPDRIVWAGEGDTPLVHARELGRKYGLDHLHLKYEAANPTRSTKDRMATVALSFLAERGVREITVSSTGNSSTSFGTVAPLFGDLRLHIFCGQEFVDRLNFDDAPNVRVYAVPGSFVQAGKAAKEFADREGFVFERGFFNPARREGLKLAYLESFDAMSRPPAVIIQAISSGMGIYGAYKGIAEYRALGRLAVVPRVVCAQQASCAPMYRGWRAGQAMLDESSVDPRPSGLAEAILRGDARATYPIMNRIVERTAGCFTAVTDAEIVQARADALNLEGLAICYASAVALASAGKLAGQGWAARDEPVLVNLTGADRPRTPVPTVLPYPPPALHPPPALPRRKAKPCASGLTKTSARTAVFARSPLPTSSGSATTTSPTCAMRGACLTRPAVARQRPRCPPPSRPPSPRPPGSAPASAST